MSRNDCRDCELLKDFYWLKVNRFLLTLKSVSKSHSFAGHGREKHEQEVSETKEEALRALCMLVAHLKSCYALDRELPLAFPEDQAA